jgi:ferredoxin
MVAMVDRDMCSACGACVDACPENALTLHDHLAIDERRCTACGVCIAVCPSQALQLGWRATRT